jgi:hypothetical protein
MRLLESIESIVNCRLDPFCLCHPRMLPNQHIRVQALSGIPPFVIPEARHRESSLCFSDFRNSKFCNIMSRSLCATQC